MIKLNHSFFFVVSFIIDFLMRITIYFNLASIRDKKNLKYNYQSVLTLKIIPSVSPFILVQENFSFSRDHFLNLPGKLFWYWVIGVDTGLVFAIYYLINST
jgi:hypothetical protein